MLSSKHYPSFVKTCYLCPTGIMCPPQRITRPSSTDYIKEGELPLDAICEAVDTNDAEATRLALATWQ